MRSFIAYSIISVSLTATSVAVALSPPVTFAAWDFDDGDLVADVSGAPFVSVAPVLFGGTGGLAPGSGRGGGNAIQLNPPPDFATRHYADFTVTNTHPTETISLELFSFDARRPVAFVLSMNYVASDDFEREIDDAVPAGSAWGSNSFDLAFLTSLGQPNLNFEMAPGTSMTMRLVHLESDPANADTLLIDNVVLTGRTVVPEPGTPLLSLASLALLFRRRRRIR